MFQIFRDKLRDANKEGRSDSKAVSLSVTKSTLIVYFLTFGFFGYGSEITFDAPISLAPAVSGLVGILLLACISAPLDSMARLTLRGTKAFMWRFSLVFSLNGLAFLAFHGRELTLDELAFTRLATTHAREVLSRITFIEHSSQASMAIQVITLLIILFFVLPICILIFRLPLRMSLLAAGLAVFVMQIGYSQFGGWGWGYTEVSWMPYVLSIALFGVQPLVLKFVSIAIFSLGVAAIWHRLDRLVSHRVVRALVVLSVLVLPAPFQALGLVDHVGYYLVFFSSFLVVLDRDADSTAIGRAIQWLAIGVLFRVTLIFPLVLLIGYWLLFCKTRRTHFSFFSPPTSSLVVLSSYLLGFWLFPAVYSGPSDMDDLKLEGGIINELALSFERATSEFGLHNSVFLGLALTLLIARRAFKEASVATLLALGFFVIYFLALEATDVSGQVKYTIEWQTALILWASASIAQNLGKGDDHSRHFASTAILSLLVALNISAFGSGVVREARSAQPMGLGSVYKPSLGFADVQQFMFEAGIEYCTPIGPMFGGTNELLFGRSVRTYLFAEKSYWVVQELQANSKGSWLEVSADNLEKSELSCVYGTSASFPQRLEGDWILHFPEPSQTTTLSVRLYLREPAAMK